MTDIKEARGLEVVASLHQHFDGRRRVQVPNGVYDQDAGWGAKVEPLSRLSDATAVIDQLLAELAALNAAVPDRVAMAKALCNYHADLCGVSRDDQWFIFSDDFLNDVDVMLAAAPAQPQSDAVIVPRELLVRIERYFSGFTCDEPVDVALGDGGISKLRALLGVDQPAPDPLEWSRKHGI